MYDSRSRVCNTCGRVFIPALMHQYKIKYRRKTYIACCYSCFTQMKSEINKQKELHKRQ